MDPDIDHRLVRYLLGELSETEERDLEQQYFQNQVLFERVQQAESELVDAYARGELSPRECEALERRLLTSPRGRETAALSRALHHLAARQAAAKPPAAGSRADAMRKVAGMRSRGPRRLVPAAAVLLCATGLVVWLLQFGTAPAPPAAPEASQPATVKPVPQPDVDVPVGPESGVIAVALAPGLLRDRGPTTTIDLPAGTRLIRVDLELRTAVPERCRAIVTTVEGREVLRTAVASRPDSTVARIDIPSTALRAGDYILTLSADTGQGTSEDVADVFFRLVKR